MDVLEQLVQEHREVEQMIADLEGAETVHERELILVDIGEALAKHMDVEEQRVYPMIEERLGSGETQISMADHDSTRADLAVMVDTTESDEFLAAVASFKAGLSRHVEREERDLFPWLQQNAENEIAALGDGAHLEEEVQEELTDESLVR
jgi:hemerythrin-like domain-containing protein